MRDNVKYTCHQCGESRWGYSGFKKHAKRVHLVTNKDDVVRLTYTPFAGLAQR